MFSRDQRVDHATLTVKTARWQIYGDYNSEKMSRIPTNAKATASPRIITFPPVRFESQAPPCAPTRTPIASTAVRRTPCRERTACEVKHDRKRQRGPRAAEMARTGRECATDHTRNRRRARQAGVRGDEIGIGYDLGHVRALRRRVHAPEHEHA